MTQIANTLMAKDYKGLGNQMMTTAMMCLQSIKESDQKSEQKQIASPQEKTEDSADTNRKEH